MGTRHATNDERAIREARKAMGRDREPVGWLFWAAVIANLVGLGALFASVLIQGQ